MATREMPGRRMLNKRLLELSKTNLNEKASVFLRTTKLLPADFERVKENYLSLDKNNTAQEHNGIWWGYKKGSKTAEWKYTKRYQLVSDLAGKEVFDIVYKRRGYDKLI